MRKMKRAISLVLTLVMLLGMVMIPTGAVSNFSDADLIKNKEAVAITSGIGLFAGTADGQFAPKAAVTRAQMATIIVKMLRGSDFNADAFKGVGVNPFPDTADFEGGWAEGYINACYQMGVVAGYGDGTFKPGRELTTAEALTMIINALGVDPGEGDWPTNYMAKAEEMKLYGDLASKPATNAPLTRDQLAVLAWEGLQYSPEGRSGWRIDGYDMLFESYADALKAAGGDAGLVNEAVGEDSLASKVYELKSATGWITGNAATGVKYTGVSKADGTIGKYNVETGLDMIGHYVTVYYKEQYTSDKQPGHVYTIVDESTVVTVEETITASKDYKAAFGSNYSMAGTNGSGVMLFDSAYDCDTNNDGTPEFGAITGYAVGSAAPKGTYIIADGVIVAYIAPVTVYASYITGISNVEDSESVSIKKATGADVVPNTSEDDRVIEYTGMAVGDFVTYVKVATGNGNYVYVLSPVSKVFGVIAKTSGTEVDGVHHDTITINGTEYLSFEPADQNYVGTKLENEPANISWGQTYVLYLTKSGEYIGFEQSSGVASMEDTVFILESNILREKNAYGQYVFYCKARGIDMTGAEVEILIGTAKDANNNGEYDPDVDLDTLGDMEKRKHEFESSSSSGNERVGVFYTVSDSSNSEEKKAGIKTLTPYASGYTGDDSLYVTEADPSHNLQNDEYTGATTASIPVTDGTFASSMGTTQFFTIQYDREDPSIPLKTTVEVGSMASEVDLEDKTVRMVVERDPSAPTVATNILAFVNVIEITEEWSEYTYIYVSQKQLDEVGLTTQGVSYTVYDAKTGAEVELIIDPDDCTGTFTTPGFYRYQTDTDNFVRTIKSFGTTDSNWDIDGAYVPQVAYSLGYLGATGDHIRAERLGLNLIDYGYFDNAESASAAVLDLRTAAEIEASGVSKITSRSQMDDALANDPGVIIIFDLFMYEKSSIMNYTVKTMYIKRVVSGTVGLNGVVYAEPIGTGKQDVDAVVVSSFAASMGDTMTISCDYVTENVGPGFYRYIVDEADQMTLVPVVQQYASAWSKIYGWHDKIASMTQNADKTYALTTADSCTLANCSADCMNNSYEHGGSFKINGTTLIQDAAGTKYTAEGLKGLFETSDVSIDYYCGTANGEVARLIVINDVKEKVHVSSGDHDPGHENWQVAANTITGAGDYYLNGNSGAINITASGKVTLCLNGYDITGGLTVSGAELYLCNCNYTDGQPRYEINSITGGSYAVVVKAGAKVTLDDAITCAGVKVGSGAEFTMKGGTVSDSTSSGVYLDGGTFTMNGGTITGNKATNGGGVYVAGGTFTMNGGTITGNTATGNGGGVYVAGGTLAMKGGAISYNETGVSTTNYGGGVYVAAGATLAMENSNVRGNTSYRGGGVYVDGGTLTMGSGSTISGNTAENRGGGVYFNGGKLTMSSDSTISGNTAKNRGGGVYINLGTVELGGAITGNTSVDNGGGVLIAGTNTSTGITKVTITGTISGNKAGGQGGGVYINSDTGNSHTIGSDGTGTISGNTATGGGAIYINVGTLAIKGGVIDGEIKRGSSDAKVTITGGTFTQDPANYLAEGYQAEQDGDTWVVQGAQYSVTVGTVVNGVVAVDPTSGAVGTTVTVTATPNDPDNYKLGAILVDGTAIGGTTFQITDNHTVTAEFVEIEKCTTHVKNNNAAVLLEKNMTTLSDGTYYLNEDITADGAITVTGDVTLCLNDNVLMAPSTVTGSFITVSANASLTICGGENGAGKIQGNSSADARGIYVDNKGALTLNSGIITGFKTTGNGGAVGVYDSGRFTMNGGAITGNESTGKYPSAVYTWYGPSNFYMNGGSISGGVAFGSGESKKMEMTGGTIEGEIKCRGVNVTVKGGNVEGVINVYNTTPASTITITGGTFAFDPSDYVDTDAYEVTDNSNGTWTVSMK